MLERRDVEVISQAIMEALKKHNDDLKPIIQALFCSTKKLEALFDYLDLDIVETKSGSLVPVINYEIRKKE